MLLLLLVHPVHEFYQLPHKAKRFLVVFFKEVFSDRSFYARKRVVCVYFVIPVVAPRRPSDQAMFEPR